MKKMKLIILVILCCLSCKTHKDSKTEILNIILNNLSETDTTYHIPPPLPNSSEKEILERKNHYQLTKKLEPILLLNEKFVTPEFFNRNSQLNAHFFDNVDLSKTEKELIRKLYKVKNKKQVSIDISEIHTPVKIVFEKNIIKSKHRVVEKLYVSEIFIENNYACLYYQYGSYGVFQYGGVAILKKENGEWKVKEKVLEWIT